MQVELSIDAGFGVTKFSYRPDRSTGKVAFDSFPSVAVPMQRTPNAPEASRSRRMALVEYKGNTYGVGQDAFHELAGNMFAREMSESYYTSDTYHALMRGALSYMNEEVVDVLVLGLPMERFDYPAQVDALQQSYTGKIDIDSQRSVLIKQVIIHPQPCGGYIGLGRHVKEINQAAKEFPLAQLPEIKTAQDILDLRILVVDVGTYTLHWLFMKPGGYVRNASSAANNAGRHRIVRLLYDCIKTDLGEAPPISFLFDIDQAERICKPVRVNGQAFNLQDERFQSLIRGATNDSIQQMLAHIGSNIQAVDMIAVVGGEPNHTAAAIRRKLPEIPLFVVPAKGESPSIFTNLVGFQEYAEEAANSSK